MEDMIFNVSAKLTETHQNLQRGFGPDASVRKGRLCFGQGSWNKSGFDLGRPGQVGIWKATAMLHYPCASCASCACACDVFFLFVKSG